jgi:hypothetical protein
MKTFAKRLQAHPRMLRMFMILAFGLFAFASGASVGEVPNPEAHLVRVIGAPLSVLGMAWCTILTLNRLDAR